MSDRNTSSSEGRRIPRSSSAMPSSSRARPAAMSTLALPETARLISLRSAFESGWRGAERGHQRGGPLEVRPIGQPDLEHVATEPVLELVRRSLGDDASAVEHDDPVGEVLGLLHVLRREQDRRALGHQLVDELPQVVPRPRIEPGRRLVEEEDRGSTDETGRQVETSPHAARVGLDGLVPRTGERHPLQGLLGPTPVDRPIEVVEESDEFEVLAAGQQLVDRGVLAREPYQGADRRGVLVSRRDRPPWRDPSRGRAAW